MIKNNIKLLIIKTIKELYYCHLSFCRDLGFPIRTYTVFIKSWCTYINMTILIWSMVRWYTDSSIWFRKFWVFFTPNMYQETAAQSYHASVWVHDLTIYTCNKQNKWRSPLPISPTLLLTLYWRQKWMFCSNDIYTLPISR